MADERVIKMRPVCGKTMDMTGERPISSWVRATFKRPTGSNGAAITSLRHGLMQPFSRLGAYL
jgi:hypothetical protein